MSKRLGFVGIIVDGVSRDMACPCPVITKVNEILSDYASLIAGRMGVPYKEKNCSVITIIVDASTDELGQLTGKLGQLEGVSVKSALSKNK